MILVTLLTLTVSIAPYDFAGQQVERVAVWTKVDDGRWYKSSTPILPGETSVRVNRTATCGVSNVQAKARAERVDTWDSATRYSEEALSPVIVPACDAPSAVGPVAPTELIVE